MSKNSWVPALLTGIGLALTVAVPNGQAGTSTFGGAGLWSDPTKWTGDGSKPPAAADDVVIAAAANCTSDVATVSSPLNSYLLSATAKHTLLGTNEVTVTTSVTINGTLTHATNTATSTVWVADNVVNVSAATITVAAGGIIDVNGKGYGGPANAGAGPFPRPSYGPGGGTQYDGNYSSGGSYGGRGGSGIAEYGWTSADTYGSTTAPLDPGSGGADGGCTAAAQSWGGGAVHLKASGQVTVNGTISANGVNGGAHGQGGGSGGGVYIECGTIAGSGFIRADGGYSQARGSCGAGSGGRISVVYSTALSPTVQFSANGGGNGNTTTFTPSTRDAEPGTVYLSDSTFYPYSTLYGCGRLIIGAGFTSWAPDSLTVTGGTLRLPDGFALTVTNDLIIKDNGRLDMRKTAAFDVRGTLIVSNAIANGAAALSVRPSATNGTTTYGAYVGVSNTLYIGNMGYVYPYSEPTNGGSVMFTVNDLVVASGGRIDGDAKGYTGGDPMTSHTNGYGPGGGVHGASGVSAQYGSGGGYGGSGGQNNYGGPRSATYGVASAPVDPGSGGGSSAALIRRGGDGGSLVRIKVRNAATIDGTISANGRNGCQYGGGGSGGGIYIDCGTLSGAGLFTAEGGGNANETGGGGGGRIALWYSSLGSASFQFSAAGNSGHLPGWTQPYQGQQGTLYLPDTTLLQTNLMGGYTLVLGSGTNWGPGSLTISNGPLRFPDGFTVVVTNDLTLAGPKYGPAGVSVACSGGQLWMANGSTLSVGGNILVTNDSYLLAMTNGSTLYCGGNLTVSNYGSFYDYAGVSNQYGCGALVTVAGSVIVATNGFIYPYSHGTNGGSVHFDVKNFIVQPGGLVDANARGYQSVNGANGFGPGGGGRASTQGGGGGYGGKGGAATAGGLNGGIAYGSSNAPLDPGSSGGSWYSGNYPSGAGGGFVKVVASRQIRVDGTITANGGWLPLPYGANRDSCGGGAGGGIYLCAKTFSGNGTLYAVGSGPGTGANCGGGGGGRIAVWRQVDLGWAGSPLTASDINAVTGGVGRGTGETGGVGTVFFGYVPNSGTVFIVH